ncbi:phage antirepressor KilAC domain-containing protein [Paenibacillus sp. FSL K6-1230]|uniref:phage antirepressor KilAC domain-containing protein n=1 Tax=Paenibacillus sp. FSL K6-1230 TaxID=2921603 RepID=UPI0030F8FF65
MTQLVTIHGVRGYIDDKGTAQLNLEDVARGLGFTETKGNYIRWQRVETYLSEFGFSTSGEKPDYIPENIFYRLAMKAKNAAAEEFQAKVADDILPSIRRTGMYATTELLDNPDLLIEAATRLKQEREEKRLLQAQIEQDKPKVLFADAVSASKTSILVGELAKILKQNGVQMGQKRLFSWLRDNGFLIRRNGTDYNMPTQRSMEMGLFEIKETSITHSDGHITINKTPKITGKGQVYFINKFKVEAV